MSAPIEVIEEQKCHEKLKVRKDKVKKSATSPSKRKRSARSRNKILPKEEYFCQKSDVLCNSFAQELGLKNPEIPFTMEGRVLEAPTIWLKNKKIEPRNGEWSIHGENFFVGVQVHKWTLLSFADESVCGLNILENFSKLLIKTACEKGVVMQLPATIDIANLNTPIADVLKDMKDKYQPNLIVCVLPRRKRDDYVQVKKTGDIFLGLTTQCVSVKSVRNHEIFVLRALCQKMNTKLGGINISLNPRNDSHMFHKRVLIMGATVSHINNESYLKEGISIAVLVGSLDVHPYRYTVTVKAQRQSNTHKRATDSIIYLKEMAVQVLKTYCASTNGTMPEVIIFYRSGICETQFNHVKEYEVKTIQEASRSSGHMALHLK